MVVGEPVRLNVHAPPIKAPEAHEMSASNQTHDTDGIQRPLRPFSVHDLDSDPYGQNTRMGRGNTRTELQHLLSEQTSSPSTLSLAFS